MPPTPLPHQQSKIFRLLDNGLYFLVPLVLVAGCCLLLNAALEKPKQANPAKANLFPAKKQEANRQNSNPSPSNLFPIGEILDVQITLDDKDWDTVRNQSPNPTTKQQKKPKYKTAQMKIGGIEFPEIGIRKKGFGRSQSSDRPSLKIKLNHVDLQAQINGLTILTFNNNLEDASLMSQAMGYAMYNAAGSPAPRCGYAKITVNGKNLGIYSHVETIRKPLLKRDFKDDRGTLYEGTAVDFFEGRESDFEKEIGKDLIGRTQIKKLIELLEQDDLTDVDQTIGKLVDLDSFYIFWAVEALIGFRDGYTGNADNYFVYFNPATEKLHFLPWGIDLAFEKYRKIDFTDRAPLSVKTKGRLTNKLYQFGPSRQRFVSTLKQLLEAHWEEEKLIAEVDRREAMLKPHLTPTQVSTFQVNGIRNFIRTRRAELDQLQYNEDLFPTSDVLDVQITLEENDWNTIRHQSRNFFSALSPQRKSGPVEGPYTYVKAKVKIGGIEFPEVGLRKKGFLGSQNSERPSLKIKLNHVNDQAEINGMSMLTFNNNQQDISLMSQAMGYAIYNAAGSPAPRCGYAKISVNGKNLGVYSHVESVRKLLLKRGFSDNKGTLYEGTVVDFFEGWDASFENKVGEDAIGRKKINQLIEVLEQNNLPDMEKAIGEFVDLDSFYTFWAVEGLIGFWDGYTANNNNFFVYLNPKTEKFHFLPWGLDCAFEKYSKLPGNNRRAPLSVKTKGRVAYRLYQIESCRQRYARTLKEIMDEHWDEEELIAEIDRRHAVLEPHLARTQARKFQVKGIQNFIRVRREELMAEISDGMPIWTAKPSPPVILPDFSKLFQPKGGSSGNIWALAKSGDLDGLKKAVAKGDKVNGQDIMGITPLAYAAYTGRIEAMNFLISKGAEVNVKNKDGGTPLLGAAFLGRVEAVNLLLAKGADPNIRNDKGETPLDTSSGEWNEELRGLVGLIAGFLQIKIDAESVKSGRPKIAEILRAKGGKSGSELDNTPPDK